MVEGAIAEEEAVVGEMAVVGNAAVVGEVSGSALRKCLSLSLNLSKYRAGGLFHGEQIPANDRLQVVLKVPAASHIDDASIIYPIIPGPLAGYITPCVPASIPLSGIA